MNRRQSYHAMNPRSGISPAPANASGSQAVVPTRTAWLWGMPFYRALSPAVDRQNRSFKALSGKGSAPATPPPFRHTPGRLRPRYTATVWRNLKQNLQHAPNHYSSFIIYHSSLSFTFSAKEKDSETGLSYFGSRYYSSDLSIWLSVDPMAAKYASLSPYVYCANNPVRCVDPNGEEIGQYLDWNGNFLGTDGKEDISVYFVSDEESINIITKNNEAQRVTSRSAVTVDWKTDIIEIEAIISVYDRTVINGGDRGEV